MHSWYIKNLGRSVKRRVGNTRRPYDAPHRGSRGCLRAVVPNSCPNEQAAHDKYKGHICSHLLIE